MGKLTGILRENGRHQDLNIPWTTAVAPEDGVLPIDTYTADIIKGEAYKSSGGHAAFKMTFVVTEGDFKGRRFWHDVYFSKPAEDLARRDIAKLGFSVFGDVSKALEELEKPWRAAFRCEVRLGVKPGVNGSDFNKVLRFRVLETRPMQPDPFAAPRPGDGVR